MQQGGLKNSIVNLASTFNRIIAAKLGAVFREIQRDKRNPETALETVDSNPASSIKSIPFSIFMIRDAFFIMKWE